MTHARLGHGRVDAGLRTALIAQQELGVAVCDADGVLIDLNPTLESILDEPYTLSEPGVWSNQYHLYDEPGEQPLPMEDMPLLRALRGEPVVDELITTRPAHGSIRHLRCNGARLFDGDRVAGAVVFVADVTSQIRQRQALDALRERLVETVNHELRTPVSTLKGHVELLQDLGDRLPPPTRWSLEAIDRSLRRLEHVLDTIRELADLAATPTHEADSAVHRRPDA